MTQRMIYIDSPVFVREPELKAKGIENIFPDRRPLALEIGCGVGDFLVQEAARRPEWNFVAIDIFNKGCLKTCNRVEATGLTNIRVMRAEARWLLNHFVPPQSLAAVYINCPDPWPKKRHRSRRLVNRTFLELLRCHLAPGGHFWFATDFADYAEMVADILPTVEGYIRQTETPYTTDLGDYPVSKYMRRFLEQGQPIHLFHYRRAEDLPAELLKPPGLEPGFRLRWLARENRRNRPRRIKEG
ncbi:tRNA (guanine-N(7)-)-methyltransferase [Geothermobacter ehrlichii]|uniref:tRNA (guanine-N(7)-)-methyltransferase n=1 Tax=Geothermobacter ehrlichii TaxID=213224 RepID=A0A5D3WI41_9BACT|nr:tRNA (guanosine(46)-N7)-methyltransferase TrmB [Geothermobacter ehrlichii]TYO97520.1 tRNA (guanine-N(7)-)-methyltransferase [Geothermobacter ehrlichii]